MGRIITFINEKGGIGKTSCCFNIAWELAKDSKILLIDLDGQRANLTYFCGYKMQDTDFTMHHVLLENKSIHAAVKNIKDGLDLIPANYILSTLSPAAKISTFKKSLQSISGAYDYILIDVNPTPNWTHSLALSCTDHIIIPMLPDITSLEANLGICESIAEVKDTTNPNLNVLGMVFNKYAGRINLAKQVTEIANGIASRLETTVFSTTIRNAVSLSENVYFHQGITDYDPKSGVAEDIRNLIIEMKERLSNGC